MGKSGIFPNSSIGRLLLPLYVSGPNRRFKLVGSSVVYTVGGRFFIATAAHVANILRSEQAVLRGKNGYFSVEIPFLSTSGKGTDRFDVAVAEMHPSVFATLGDVVEFTDLPAVTQDFVTTRGNGSGISGLSPFLQQEQSLASPVADRDAPTGGAGEFFRWYLPE